MNYTTLGRKVSILHPEITRELIIEPMLKDQNLIPLIFKSHIEGRDLKVKEQIAVILKLYDPDALEGWKTLCPGIRPRLAELLNISPNAISNHLNSIHNYWLIYSSFQAKVNSVASEISNCYTQK